MHESIRWVIHGILQHEGLTALRSAESQHDTTRYDDITVRDDCTVSPQSADLHHFTTIMTMISMDGAIKSWFVLRFSLLYSARVIHRLRLTFYGGLTNFVRGL